MTRTEVEDQCTIVCLGCGFEQIDIRKHPGQKYPKRCFGCGRTGRENRRIARKQQRLISQLVLVGDQIKHRAEERAMNCINCDSTVIVYLRLPKLAANAESYRNGERSIDFLCLQLAAYCCLNEMEALVAALKPVYATIQPWNTMGFCWKIDRR